MKTLKILVLVAVGLAAAIFLSLSRTGPSVPSGENVANASQSMNPIELKSTTDAKRETAILAGGCFWGMEEILRNIPGVLETAVGYTGGATEAPNYQQICTGTTGHAEAVRIVFDPARLTYEALLGYFYRMHDPTTLNRQHNDIGTQYRSAIFFTSDEQKAVAAKVTETVGKSGRFKKPIVTQIVPATEFFNAEDYHQKYLVKNPGGYNCHILRD
jgi:methionine-S-sulfoxide reductase